MPWLKYKSTRKKLTIVWPNPIWLLVVSSDGVVENIFAPKPVDGVLNIFAWPNPGVVCPKDGVWPKAELDCPIEGVLDWKRGDCWVFPKFKPLLNGLDVVPWADVEPKIDVEVPNADVVAAEPKGDAGVPPNVDVVEPNKEGAADDVDPKGFALVVLPKAEEPKAEVDAAKPGVLNGADFWPKGFVALLDENGFAGADAWPNVDEELKGLGWVLVPKPAAPAGWAAEFGPPNK